MTRGVRLRRMDAQPTDPLVILPVAAVIAVLEVLVALWSPWAGAAVIALTITAAVYAGQHDA
jgi:hypothetical protein